MNGLIDSCTIGVNLVHFEDQFVLIVMNPYLSFSFFLILFIFDYGSRPVSLKQHASCWY